MHSETYKLTFTATRVLIKNGNRLKKDAIFASSQSKNNPEAFKLIDIVQSDLDNEKD